MTPGEEHQLYHADRAAWIAQAAPGAARALLRNGREAIRFAWSQIGDDYKAAIKSHLSASERQVFVDALSTVRPSDVQDPV